MKFPKSNLLWCGKIVLFERSLTVEVPSKKDHPSGSYGGSKVIKIPRKLGICEYDVFLTWGCSTLEELSNDVLHMKIGRLIREICEVKGWNAYVFTCY